MFYCSSTVGIEVGIDWLREHDPETYRRYIMQNAN